MFVIWCFSLFSTKKQKGQTKAEFRNAFQASRIHMYRKLWNPEEKCFPLNIYISKGALHNLPWRLGSNTYMRQHIADTINGFRNAQKSRHVFTISLSDRPLLTFQWLMIRCNFITVGKAELLNIEMQIIYDWITFKHSSGSLLNYSCTFDVWLVT